MEEKDLDETIKEFAYIWYIYGRTSDQNNAISSEFEEDWKTKSSKRSFLEFKADLGLIETEENK